MITSRRLLQYSSNGHLLIFPQDIYHYTRSRLHVLQNCFHAYSMRSGWPRHNFPTYPYRWRSSRNTPPRSLSPRSTFAPSFRRYLKTRSAYAHLMSFVGGGGVRAYPGDWLDAVRVAQADPRGLQRRQLALYVYTGAGRPHPQSRSLSSCDPRGANGLRYQRLFCVTLRT